MKDSQDKPDATKAELCKIIRDVTRLRERTRGDASNWLFNVIDNLHRAVESAKK